MKLRILTAIVGIGVLVPILLFSDTIVLPLAAAFFCVIGVWEMTGCIGIRSKLEVLIPSMIFTAATQFGARYITAAAGKAYFLAIFSSVAFLYMFYLLVLAVFSKGTKPISEMALVAITTIYQTVGFFSIILLRDMDFGSYMFALVFVGAWVPDGAAYFVGRALGKHKLIPDVSPKKTVEGAIGGFVFGGIAFAIVGLIANIVSNAQAHYIELVVTGLVIAVISMCGDLIASLIKRQYNIKDYGKLLPGHGGVWDRFDSIFAITPFLVMISSHPDIFTLLG